MKRRTFCAGAATAALAATAPRLAAAAGDTVTILVPFAAGGSGDITARLLGQFWQEKYGQTVVVENKPGANGIIGMQAAKAASADGRTLVLASTSTFAANPSLFRSLPYDPEKDFTLVAVLGAGGSYLLVRPEAPWKTVAEFVATAKAKPRELTYGYFNATSQVPGALLAARAGIELTGVPYRQIGQALTDLTGGQIQCLFVDTTAGDSAVSSGRLRALGVTSAKRLPRFPDLPTLAESYPGFVVTGNLGIAVRAETPEADKLEINRRVDAAIVAEPMKGRLADFGFAVEPLDLPASIAYARAERAKWAEYVALAKIEPQ
ncbi:MAG: tripartite tricarboxylate transporter substrate binding protein [Reyranellaceae bacterium]